MFECDTPAYWILEPQEEASTSPPPSSEPVEISEPKPEQALEAETKSPEAPPEAEPITEQPQKNEDVGQTANADKAPEKVTFDIPGRITALLLTLSC